MAASILPSQLPYTPIIFCIVLLNIQTIDGIDISNFPRLPEVSVSVVETTPGPRAELCSMANKTSCACASASDLKYYGFQKLAALSPALYMR